MKTARGQWQLTLWQSSAGEIDTFVRTTTRLLVLWHAYVANEEAQQRNVRVVHKNELGWGRRHHVHVHELVVTW